jgi:hypothetical protein
MISTFRCGAVRFNIDDREEGEPLLSIMPRVSQGQTDCGKKAFWDHAVPKNNPQGLKPTFIFQHLRHD